MDDSLKPTPEANHLNLPAEKEYLSLEELVDRIPYRPQTIRNLMYQGILREGLHYFKPTQRKVVFKWAAIRCWIEDQNRQHGLAIPLARGR